MTDWMDITDIAKEVRKELKEAFPECKFSVTIQRFAGGRSMSVSLMEAPENPLLDGEDYAQINDRHIRYDDFEECWKSNGYRLTGTGAQLLSQAVKIANRRNWDNSDTMIDYFDVNYYFHLEVGKWNRPFQISRQ